MNTATVNSKIIVNKPSKELIKWCLENLMIINPEYVKKKRMGFWTGGTPQALCLYEMNGDKLIIPFGCLRDILPMLDKVIPDFKRPPWVDYKAHVDLYDYQCEAVFEALSAHYGILKAPAGSGKTQMGIAMAVKLQAKTLWLTHTADLLKQSKERAERYIDKSLIGTITEGKVNIGKGITFATIQTMARLDLALYKDEWELIIVDECHHVAGTPTAMTQFSKVLNSLSARHKYGLSATVHRADGLIKATYALLGNVVYEVPAEAVNERIMSADVQRIDTGITLSPMECCNTDGTLNYAKMITFLTNNKDRNYMIIDTLNWSKSRYNLILSERVSHLQTLMMLLGEGVMIDGKTPKKERDKAIEDMRTGKERYLFATYQLAKEGLDIPRLDALHLVTPQKDYAVITQAVGRVCRVFEGKKEPIVYDYVDNSVSLEKSWKRRCTSYRKCGCGIR